MQCIFIAFFYLRLY